MTDPLQCDVAFIGHYTKDTIVYPDHEMVQDGGAYRFGAHVAVAMGLRAAVVTHLAREDRRATAELEAIGVRVVVHESPHSTCLRIVYPNDNPDMRSIYLTSQAEPFSVADVAGVQARAYHIGASVRGEVPAEVVRHLAGRGALVSLDAQGYTRVAEGCELRADPWAASAEVLPWVSVFKVDAGEAEAITGEADIHAAIRRLAGLGPREVLLTHRGGVLVWAEGHTCEAPFAARSLAGRTGRGDTCTGAYVSRRLLGGSPEEACTWAAAVTSLKIEQPGPFRRPIAEVEALICDKYAQ
ncbi:MAG TPA: PfkB family carbohydrate kinase [Anaerolineae bacterium]|nr:PfkB family carbohydrate kinase [Anaerolineae bacterium]HPL26465.1 PfkB family carbohydrate kinase [Anaerolineae bacterium]